MSHIHFAVIDHRDKYYTMEETVRYIEMKVVHVTYYYENGVEKKKKVYSNIRDCTEQDFIKEKFEHNYYK